MDTLAIIKIVESIYEIHGYPLVFLSSFIEITPMGWAVPGGVILAVAGYFSFGSKIGLYQTIIFGSLGAWCTFLGSYFLGKRSGYWLVNKLGQQKNAERAKKLLKNHGGVILTTSMLANLTRFWVAYIAGVDNYNFIKFFVYSGLASLTWVSLMVMFGFLAGSERSTLETKIASAGIVGWIFLVIAVAAIAISIKKEFMDFKEDKIDQ